MNRVVCLIVSVVVLTSAASASGQYRKGYPKYKGKQIITVLQPVEAPDAKGKKFGDATAEGVVLAVADWMCGVQFTDQQNRRWRLARGDRISHEPGHLSGWLITTNEGKSLFLTTSGTLFCTTGPAAAGINGDGVRIHTFEVK